MRHNQYDQRPLKIYRAVIFSMMLSLGAYNQLSHDQPIQVIKAMVSPVKVKPDDPGGLVVPYRDMNVYCLISQCND